MATAVSARVITKRDLVVGTAIAVAMGTAFTFLSSGWSLIVTFVPGVVLTALTFGWLYVKQTPLPEGADFIPAFMGLLAIQFLHFGEEFVTGFATQFPVLYGGAPYSPNLFVTFNMAAYFVFSVACLAAFWSQRWFLLIPALFFIIYGAIGNAIAHSWWSASLGAYFPGLITAQAYWVCGPLVLSKVLGGGRAAVIVVCAFIVILIPLLTIYASPSAAVHGY